MSNIDIHPQAKEQVAETEHFEGEKRLEEPIQLKSTFDTLSAWQAAKTFRYTATMCMLAAFCVVTDGYQNQLAGSIIASKGFISTLTNGGPALDPAWVSTFGGLTNTGFVIGQLSIFTVHERFGRKGAMYAYTAVLTLAVIVESVTTQWWHWTIAKVLSGAGIGAVQATVPVYINEHAPSQIRGLLIVSYSLWFNIGNLLASVVLKVRADANPMDWRTSIYTQLGLLGLTMLIIPFLPESPWWLASRGRTDDARKILHRKYAAIPNYNIEEELGIIYATIEQQKAWDAEARSEGRFALLKGLNGKRFIIGAWPKILQQFVGLSVFSSYAAYFFQLAGNRDPFLVTVILAVVGIVAVLVDASLIDKIGRRLMTLIGFGGACFGVITTAIVGCFDYRNSQLGAVLVFAGVISNFFNTFQASTSYAYLTEMPEQRFRSMATGWGLGFANMIAVLFQFTVPLMLKVWVVKTAFLFVGLGVPGTIIAYFIMPETSRRSNAEIHEMLVDRISLRKWKGHKTEVERELEARMSGQPA